MTRIDFYVVKKFCDLFTLRPSDLKTTLTLVLWKTFVLFFQIFYKVSDNKNYVKVRFKDDCTLEKGILP